MTTAEGAETLHELADTPEPSPEPVARPGRPAPPAPSLGERVLHAIIVASKAIVIVFGIDAFLNHRSRRLRGKAIRTRAVGYVGGLFIVPVLWRLLPDRGRYPAELDLAVRSEERRVGKECR